MTDQKNPRVIEAARWLVTVPAHDRPHPVVVSLRQRFGLTVLEACAAIAEANVMREGAQA